MKNIKLITVIVILISGLCVAQPGKLKQRFQEKKEKVKSMKVAFITNELNLTPEEAEKFWPLFNAFEEKQREIRQEKLKNYLDRSKAENLSEKEAQSLLNQMEATEDELHQLRKKFLASLKGVLPATKILKLKNAEDEFSKKLLQQYRDAKK